MKISAAQWATRLREDFTFCISQLLNLTTAAAAAAAAAAATTTTTTTSGITRILLQGARAICWDFESDAISIFLSQYISDTDIWHVPQCPMPGDATDYYYYYY